MGKGDRERGNITRLTLQRNSSIKPTPPWAANMTRNSLIYINIVNTLYSSGEEDLNKIESIYLSVGPKPNLTLAGNLYTDKYIHYL